MTRKRYVKILMAAGVTRNVANTNCETVQRVGWSYKRFYDEVMSAVVEPVMRGNEG